MMTKSDRSLRIGRVCVRVALAVVTLALLAASPVQAQTYTVRVTKSGGQRLAGVEIYGTGRFNGIFGRVTNTNGEFAFDVRNLTTPNPELVFIKGSQLNTPLGSGFRFEPSSLVVSEANCPGRICSATAIQDVREAAVLQWFVKDSAGKGIPGIPVTAPQADNPCPKLTDPNGYAIWAVTRQPAACSDLDSDLSNNSYLVVPSEPAGKRCTFKAAVSKYKACMYGVNETSGVFNASCADSSAADPIGSVSYQIKVIDNTEAPVAGVQFEGSGGISGLPSKLTDSLGRWSFNTIDVGAPAGSSFNLVPVGPYQFEPSELSLSPNSCPQNICFIRAFKNGQQSSAMTVNISTPTGEPVSGVKVSAPALQICPRNTPRETDNAGQTLFAALRVPSCSDSDNDPNNNFVSFSPELASCTFTDNSGMPFQGCPVDALNISSFTAHCGTPPPHHYYLSGTIFNSSGRGEAGVGVLNNGIRAGFTDAYGNYALVVDAGTSNLISASVKTLPFSQYFASVSANRAGIDFAISAPTPAPTPISPPNGGQDGTTTISGRVTDAQGMPLVGVQIYDGDDEWSHKDLVAQSDSSGFYSFSVLANGDSHWVTARSLDDNDDETFPRYFQPGGYFFADLDAEQVNVDFGEAANNLALIGAALDSNGNPIAGATITLSHNGGLDIDTTQTDADGWYAVSVPEGEDYILTAQKNGLTFLPETYFDNEASAPRDGMIFIGILSASPTPSNSPTAMPTTSPTQPPFVTPPPTAWPTPAPTYSSPAPTAQPTVFPSNNPTAQPTSSPTAAPTGSWPTPNPTLTPTPAPTAGPTAWPTWAPTSQPTQDQTPGPTSQPTFFPTQNNSPMPTATFVPPPTGIVTPEPSEWPTSWPTWAPTGMPTSYPSYIATPQPSAWPSGMPTSMPSWAPTAEPSQWPTPDATPESRASLASLCSYDPDFSLRWRVTNPLSRDLIVTWIVYGEPQFGNLYVPAFGQAEFDTNRVPNSPNAVIIYADGVQHDAKSPTFQRCGSTNPSPTPTLAPGQPSPTPGVTPPPGSETPMPSPSGSPSPSPGLRQSMALTPLCSDVQDGSARWRIYNPNAFTVSGRAVGAIDEESFILQADATYEVYLAQSGDGSQGLALWVEGSLEQVANNNLGSCLAAPSPTPEAFGAIQGKLMGQNGRPMNKSTTNLLNKMPRGAILALARASDGAVYSTIVANPFNFQIDVPVGVYDISIISDCVKINSASKIIRTRITDAGKKGVNFSGKALASRINRGQCSVQSPSAPWISD